MTVQQPAETAVPVPRIRSYVGNLDEQMEGGFPRGPLFSCADARDP